MRSSSLAASVSGFFQRSENLAELLRGRSPSGTSANRSRIGIGTPSPIAMASELPSNGRAEKFAAVVSAMVAWMIS